MNLPSLRSAFLVEHLDLPAATGDPEATWEVFQLSHLNNSGLFGIARKARQVGWSWLAAAEAVAESILAPRTPSIFVSINQDEASEKIRYANQIIEALDSDVRPKLVVDNKFELEIQNGSRMISHPCRPVRGKARANLYLDEFAHYPKDREIYTAAVPVTTKGGRLRIGSSPLGAGGLFWELYSETLRRYPGYSRSLIPWWRVRALCRDVVEAAKLAPYMLTEERVRTFGTLRLIEIFENVPLDDFQQEYECAWVDESVAWIPWEEIKRNQILAQAGQLLYWQAKDVESAQKVIEDVALACREGRIEGVLVGGMDVGRRHNLTEIIFIGKGTSGQLPYRLGISLGNVEFDDQKAVVSNALDKLPVTKLLIDQNGLGMQLAEDLHKRHGYKAEGADFTNATKELWSVEIKLRFQRGEIPIPMDRDLSYQIHSIKKKVMASKNVTYDTEANEKHHADKYWALALAAWAGKVDQAGKLKVSDNPFYGGRSPGKGTRRPNAAD